MAAPSSYTEAEFKAYLDSVAGELADVLGWTVGGGDYDEVVNETLLAYGVSDIANATDIQKLRALGRAEMYRQMKRVVAGRFDFAADGGSYKRSQIQNMIDAALSDATSEALVYDANYQVQQTAVIYDDYYTPADLEDDEYNRADVE